MSSLLYIKSVPWPLNYTGGLYQYKLTVRKVSSTGWPVSKCCETWSYIIMLSFCERSGFLRWCLLAQESGIQVLSWKTSSFFILLTSFYTGYYMKEQSSHSSGSATVQQRDVWERQTIINKTDTLLQCLIWKQRVNMFLWLMSLLFSLIPPVSPVPPPEVHQTAKRWTPACPTPPSSVFRTPA